MLTTEHTQATLIDYLAVFRRRGLAILATTLLVGGVAYVVSRQETKVYRASAEVLLNRHDLGSALTGTPDPLASDPVRIGQTQVGLARLPKVAARAVARAGMPERSPYDLLAHSNVHSNVDSDILSFTVDDESPIVAPKLATAYAQAFTAFSLELATATLKNARVELEQRLAALKGTVSSESALYRSLTDKIQQLRTMELLQNPGTVVKTANGAGQVRPTPTRNGMLGAVFGLLLGCALAFLWEAVDKRIRSEREIEERLGLPLLSRLPTPARRRGNAGHLAMIDDPTGLDAEAVRKLRVNFEFANLDLHARAIMITSAVQQEGKTTTIANLAVALARSGRDVVLVDLDLRRPTLASLFELKPASGVTDVALGRATLEKAIVPVALGRSAVPSMTNGRTKVGTLGVLPAGVLPANPGEFVGTEALGRVIAELRMKYEFVLVDAPPMCAVGDAMALSARIDALVVVARIGIVDRRALEELSRELHTISTPKLGFVLTGSDSTAGYGHYYRYGADIAELPDRAHPVRTTASR
jgi:succinoglycan biosynthesis transport protein ExoP